MFLRPSTERSSAFWPTSMDVAPETHLKASSDESFGLCVVHDMLRWRVAVAGERAFLVYKSLL